MIPQLTVAAAIIRDQDRFLITQRRKQSHLGHLWEFPGGKLEAGESPKDCVIRECREEIGVEVCVLGLLKTVAHSYPEVSLTLHFLNCKIVSGNPRPIECADLCWILKHEFKNFDFPEADFEVIQALSAE